MKIKNISIILMLCICYTTILGQNWPKIYFGNAPNMPVAAIETVDRGYVIGGQLFNFNGSISDGFIYKLSINGDIIWNKTLYQNFEGTSVFDINQTSDGGYIIGGSVDQYDSWGDPFIMKLNACAEKEWCRIYTVGQDRFDCIKSVRQIPGGYLAMVFYGYDLSSNDKLLLYRLDNNGDLLWQQQYGNTDSLMTGADGYDMTVTPDLNYLISGYCYYPDSGSSGQGSLRPLIINVDSSGNTNWELPWRYLSGENFYGMANRTIIDNNGTFYSCGRHIESSATPPGDRPTMLKTDMYGNEVSYHDLISNSWQAVFFNINWLQDSTIEIDGGWINNPGDSGHIGVFKVDKNGNILDSSNIMQSIYCFNDAIIDHDNKVFLISGQRVGNQWRAYAWKLNSDLEYDTLYNHPFVYDSLCPHPIASDTIPLDCMVVGLNEPFENAETGRLKVFPNPARDILHIEIPEKLKSETRSPVFNLTTVYHQWKSAMLEVYDLFGKRIFFREVNRNDKQIDIDVSAWSGGMYVVRLVYNGKTVANEKVLVR